MLLSCLPCELLYKLIDDLHSIVSMPHSIEPKLRFCSRLVVGHCIMVIRFIFKLQYREDEVHELKFTESRCCDFRIY